MNGSHNGAVRTVRLLVVDDDKAVRDSIARALKIEGYEIETLASGVEALEAVNARRADAVVLDVQMPGIDGLDTCRLLRAKGEELPILLLTARSSVGDRVVGLDAGADDYLVKPFALEELRARVRALTRRLRQDSDSSARVLTFGDLVLDPAARVVERAGRRITLTRLEFALLELLLAHPRQVLTREVIFERVWGYDFGLNSNSLEVYIGYLRRKTEEGGASRLIHTVRGVGYVLRDDGP